ncbi:MAG: beta-galactosidase, partial [Clostridiales bacterium]|nr:beta-galactosidase [Clostridiales bacterium]
MRSMRRAVHIDFHTMPGIHDFNREWDPALFAQTLSDAHVEYINAFARCNIGFAYYPTKIGIPYPGMKGDMFGDLLRECHRRDIGVSAYVNVGLD